MPANEQEANAALPNPATVQSATKPLPRRRRRWLRRVLITSGVLLVLLVVLVGFAPALLSTQAGAQHALSLANGQLRGVLRLDSLALSWTGPIELRGLHVADPQQREVLSVERITAAAGLWRFVTGGLNFQEIAIDAPQAVLYVDRAQHVSLADAFQLRTPSARSQSNTLVEPRGRIVVRGGGVRAVLEGGATYKVQDINGDLTLQTLSTLSGKLAMKLPDGVSLTSDADLRQLVTSGGFSLDRASGRASLKTSGPVELGPLLEVLAPGAELRGALNLDVQSTLEPGSLTVDFSAAAAQLQTTSRTAGQPAPVDMNANGRLIRKGNALAVHTQLAGPAANAIADITYQTGGASPAMTLDRILSAVLTGESVAMPEFSVEMQGTVDLARLQKAVPNLLGGAAGREITAGSLQVSKLNIRGGAQPTASGDIAVQDLAARVDGRAATLAPISLGFDANLQPGKGLQIGRADMKAVFGEVSAKGAGTELEATFRADLAKLRAELGQVVDFTGVELGGDVSGGLKLTRAGEERVNVSLNAVGAAIKYASGENRFDAQRASLQQTGFLTLRESKVVRFEATTADADIDGQVVASGAGWFDLKQGAFLATTEVKRAELAFAASRAAAFGAPELAHYSGTVLAQSTIERAGRDQPIISGGSLTTRGLGIDGQALFGGDAKLEWSSAKIQTGAAAMQVSLGSARFESDVATVAAQNLDWRSGKFVSIAGQLDGSADLQRLVRTVNAVTSGKSRGSSPAQPPPAIAGKLKLSATLATSEGKISITSRGGVDQFEFGSGAQTVRQQRLDFECDSRIDQSSEVIAISKVRLASSPLTAEVAGSIEHYRTSRVLSLKGRYDASWDQLTTLLHELAPATTETVIVRGQSASEFQVTGPLYQADARPVFRGAKANAEIKWATAELGGAAMGAATLAPVLRDGQILLPVVQVPAGDGRVHLSGVVDFQTPDPTLRMPGKLPLLDKVPITRQLSTSLLSRINPIFLQLAEIDGRATLILDNVVLPLGESLKTGGDGKGRLDLRNVRMRPGGLLGELLVLSELSEKEAYPVEIGAVDFVIKNGRLHYDNFTLVFQASAKDEPLDLKFYGSVGFDDALDLVVSLPVRAGLLRRLGVHGTALDIIGQLPGLRLDIPIAGSREQPRLDFSRVDKDKLVRSILENQRPEKAIDDLLRRLGGDENKNEPRRNPKRPPR